MTGSIVFSHLDAPSWSWLDKVSKITESNSEVNKKGKCVTKVNERVTRDNNITNDLMNNNENCKMIELSSKLSVICWNIRGLGDKLKNPDVQSLLFQHDVILLTETHSEPGMEHHYNIIPGYDYKDFPRKFKHQKAPCASGGIGVFARSNIINGIEFECHQESIVWVKFKSKFFNIDKDMIIGCVYFSPIDSSYIHSTTVRTDYFNILREEVAARDNCDVLLTGDFNARTGNSSDSIEAIPGNDGELRELLYVQNFNVNQTMMANMPEIRTSRDTSVNEYGKQLLSFCKFSNFKILNGRLGEVTNTSDYTCYKSTGGASVVDYLLCQPNYIDTIINFHILPKHPDSDHRPLLFEVNFPRERREKTVNNTGKMPLAYKWDPDKIEIYRRNFSEKLQNLQQCLPIEASNLDRTVDELSDMFYEQIEAAVSCTFKKKKSAQSKFPRNEWFNNECKTIKKKLHDYARNNDIATDHHADVYNTLEKEYKRIVQKNKRQYVAGIRSKLSECNSKNPSTYWQMWKAMKPPTVNNSTLTLEEFETYFRNQVTPPDVSYFDKQHMQEIHNRMSRIDFNQINNDISNEICNSSITEEEIKEHLEKLKNNKACGDDGLVGEFLKYAPHEVIPYLSFLFNSILDKGEWPEKWATGLISPVHKNNSVNLPDNYRKITDACHRKIVRINIKC